MTDHPPTDAERRSKLWSLIKDIRIGLLTTQHSNGHLHSRPMTLQNQDLHEDESLWFFMSRSGDPFGDIVASPQVNVAFADRDDDTYVSVSGTAGLSEDRTRRQQLWNKAAEAWFPKGIDDPDLALVQVRISHASYWDVKSSKLMQLYAMAKSAVTGKPPAELGETGKVRMDR
ncbi:pyridoxamine 5'-phosphate oxidase family protein [Roseateles chitosanitabidus]|jgi:general stress protein 26|uniref:pyridoxamine 5'-phosphate oxidase family protein n=1 Tax=Roseateles chitosanitabidus TaxID=65048 RepID=UPI00083065C4|nr:pyridoxamine 5'-phosphate oxidase family protein [Roseateles chitosanitabidus]